MNFGNQTIWGQPDPMASFRQFAPQNSMIWVKNRAEAEAYPIPPNTALALWDLSGPYVHRKEADMTGRPSIKTFQLVEVTAAPQPEKPQGGDFITRKEFMEFVESLTAPIGRFEKGEVKHESVLQTADA